MGAEARCQLQLRVGALVGRKRLKFSVMAGIGDEGELIGPPSGAEPGTPLPFRFVE